MRCIVICGLSGSALFVHITPETAQFPGKKVTEHKMYFDFIYNFCLKYFSFSEEFSEML